MKEHIAILFRGPIRPNVEDIAKNIIILKDCFKEFVIETFFVTWDGPHIYEIQALKLIDNYLILKEPNDSYIDTVMTSRARSEITSLFASNKTAYKQFWSQLLGIKMVISHGIYDFIVTSRPDLRIKIDNPHEWLRSKKYVMPTQECHLNYNDQFGIADSETMLKAWDYKNIDNLVELYRDCLNPENCLANIMKSNNVSFDYIEASKYELNKKRHKGMPGYEQEKKYFREQTFRKWVYNTSRIFYKFIKFLR